MFNKNLLKQWVEAGEVRISYAFDIADEIPSRLEPPPLVDFANEDSPATRAFNASYFGDRLGLRLGPIVYSHSYDKKRTRVNFKGRAGVFDLRASAGAIRIMPGEGLTVSSIENIAFGATMAAIVLPRLSLATAGLVVATTYIDPYWEGILQLYIKNTTVNPYELKIGEKIAICRFYNVLGDPEAAEVQAKFAEKSHHYALNWTKILDTDVDPQPLRKRPLSSSVAAHTMRFGKKFILDYWPLLVGGGLIVAIAGWFIAYGKLTARLERLGKFEEKVDRLNDKLAKVEDDARRIAAKQIAIGRTDVIIDAGATKGSVEIPLDRAWSPNDVAWVEELNAEARTPLRFAILPNPARADKELLRIEAERAAAEPKSVRVSVTWLIGPQ